VNVTWLLAGLAIVALVYLAFVGLLYLGGRSTDARALVRLVPDCIVLARGLLGDAEVPARYKVALGLLVAYLAMPFDLVPDFLPVVGWLDDALLVVIVLRWVLRGVGPPRLALHWRGSARGLEIVLRAGGYRPGG
jgi:uncharacterized membrane protein YkvA (DUF1232 family)